MIQPEFRSLIEILDRKLFVIPDYQRHYSWQLKQRNDLFEDLKVLQEKKERYDDRIHFMATIVCLKTGEKEQVGSNTYYIYDVVDGQQRITTLIILLKAISARLRREDQVEEATLIDRLLVKDDRRLIIIQNNHDNRSLLRNYLENGRHPEGDSVKTLADENISDAIKECEDFVDSISDVVKLLALIKEDLRFVFLSLEDKGAVYTIFEVLNSRGLEVDWLDKCKSLLMGLLYEFTVSEGGSLFNHHVVELQRYWSEIYREIGLQPIRGYEIVQVAATLKSKSDAGKPLGADEALDFFKEECSSQETSEHKIDKVMEFTAWIKDITISLSKLYRDKRRAAVTEITQARLLAAAIMLRDDLSNTDREKLLEQWERTSFKIYGLFRRRSQKKRPDYVRLAKKIVRKESSLTVREMIKAIAQIGEDLTVEMIEEQLKDKDCYTDWQDELRYFFYRYEEYLSKQNGIKLNLQVWEDIWHSNASNTVEHVLPQENGTLDWITFTDKEELLHTLGNLCLLPQGLNSEAYNHSFKIKKEVYKRANLISLNEIINVNIWSASAVRRRTNILIEFAKEQWKDLEI